MEPSARQLFHNASVLGAAGRFERSSVLVAGDRIEAVVPRGGETSLLGRRDVCATDLGGSTVIPGFVDAHFHLLALALKSLRCDLGGARSADDVVALLARAAAAHPGEEPVVGVDWDESDWDDPRPPSRRALDGVSATRPVYARRVCGHAGVVNTAFLRALDAPARFVDTASGWITEDAVFAANRRSAPSALDVAASIEGAIRSLHALGVTTIHDVVTTGLVDAYLAGVFSSRAPLRIDALLVGSLDELAALRARVSVADASRFRAVGIKLFADGSIGARTAALREPYADADARGDLLVAPEELRATLARCAAAGVTCAVHAIGDRAVDAVVGAVVSSGAKERLFRIEHAEVLGDDAVDAVARCGAFLVMQPNFVRNWGGETGLYHRRLGDARWRRTNPFRALESRGVDFVFGSDGMPPGPLFGIRGATRHPVPGQSIDVVSALRRYTELAHRLGAHGRSAGRIEPGYLADFVVLSGNPLLSDPDSIAVEATYVGGDAVFRRDAGRGPRN